MISFISKHTRYAADLVPLLIAEPSIMLKEASQGLPRVGDLIRALKAGNIDTKKQLYNLWKRQPSALQNEVMAWYKKSARPTVGAMIAQLGSQ